MKIYDGEGTIWMCFVIEDKVLLKKYNDIWNDVSNSMKKDFYSESIYNKKFLKIKIKRCDDKATYFHDEKIRNVGSNCTCLVVLLNNLFLKRRKATILKCV